MFEEWYKINEYTWQGDTGCGIVQLWDVNSRAMNIIACVMNTLRKQIP